MSDMNCTSAGVCDSRALGAWAWGAVSGARTARPHAPRAVRRKPAASRLESAPIMSWIVGRMGHVGKPGARRRRSTRAAAPDHGVVVPPGDHLRHFALRVRLEQPEAAHAVADEDPVVDRVK